jgi:hypothetical protein
VSIGQASVTASPDGVTPADPAWDGQSNTLIVADATIPAAATHLYQLRVVATVPASTPAGALGCHSSVGPGRGLFNGVTIESIGVTGKDSACAAVPARPPVPPQPPQPPVPPVPPPVPPQPPLPDTGFPLLQYLIWAALLLAAGTVLQISARRRTVSGG